MDGNAFVSAMNEALYERCNSQIPQGGHTAATGIFKNVHVDLMTVFCDAKLGFLEENDCQIHIKRASSEGRHHPHGSNCSACTFSRKAWRSAEGRENLKPDSR
jgi:hypothetical protein